MENYSGFSVLLLAAGASRRMGDSNKLLIPVGGRPMVRRSASIYCELGMDVTVVLGHDADSVRAALKGLPLDTVLNPDYERGQQSSIRVGIKNIDPPEKGLFIALSDQPLLTSADIAAFCESFLAGPRDKIMVPDYNGQRGNPVLFPFGLAAQIRTAETPVSFREFIDTHPDHIIRYQIDIQHFTIDLDTPEDLKKYALTTGPLDNRA